MATIKSYTDLEQSKKLTEILPIESSDMVYLRCDFEDEYSILVGSYHEGYTEREDGTIVPVFDEHIPCWSLAALLEQLPYEVCDEEGNSFYLQINKEDDVYQLTYTDHYEDFDAIETDRHEHFIDACFEMILKLRKFKLL